LLSFELAAVSSSDKPCENSTLLSQAFDLARNVSDLQQRDYLISEIATARLQGGDIEGAASTAMTLQQESYRQLFFEDGALKLAVSGKFAVARPLLSKIPGDHQRTLEEIAVLQAQSGDVDGALKAAESLGPGARYRILNAKAEGELDRGDLKAALATASSLRLPDDEFLWELAYAQAKAGNLQAARQAGMRIQDAGMKADIPRQIVRGYSDAGDFAAALQVATKLSPDLRRRVLCEIAEAQLKAGNKQAAQNTFSEAIRLALRIRNVGERGNSLGQIAKSQLGSGVEPTALQEMRKLAEDPAYKPNLSSLAAAEREYGNLENAEKLYLKSEEWGGAALVETERGDVARALEAAQKSSTNPANVSYTISQMAVVRARHSDYSSALALLPKIRIQGKDFEESYLADSLRKIVRGKAKEGGASEAIKWVNEQASAYARSDGLIGIAEGILESCSPKK
jgi:hypothetical protein